MSPTLNGSSALQRFERSNTVEISNGIMFDFYPGLPQLLTCELILFLRLQWCMQCLCVCNFN